jgi:hypothetical protein
MRIEHQFRVFRTLVRAVDAREVLQLAAAGLGVEPLGVPTLALGERCIDEYLEEFARREQTPRHPSLVAEGRDEGHQHDEAGVGHQPGHLGDATDVLDPVGLGESQIAIEPLPDVVAVEQIGVATGFVQPPVKQVGESGFSGTRQAGKPDAKRVAVA